MDHGVVHLLTHPDPDAGIDSDRIMEVIIDIAGSILIEFDPECVIPEVCVETAGALRIAGCAVTEFNEASRTTRAVGWSSPLAGEVATELASAKARSAEDATCLGPVIIQPLSSSTELAAAAVDKGIEVAAIMPLYHDRNKHDCLYLFGTTAQLTNTRIAAGGLVAAVLGAVTANAAVCRRSVALAAQLSNALESRVPIEQAKGLLAERFHVGVDEAFRMLRAHSRRTRTSMARAAQAVLNGGTLVAPAQHWITDGTSPRTEPEDTAVIDHP